MEVSFLVIRVIAFGTDGFKPDRADLSGYAHEVAGADIAKLPDIHCWLAGRSSVSEEV